MKLTEILPGVFVVEVEADAHGFHILHGKLYYYYSISDDNASYELPEGEWQYLGYATKDEISFDVEPYVEVCEELSYWDSVNDVFYKNYSVNEDMPMIGFGGHSNKNQAFRSLLLSKGLYWDNQLEKPEQIDFEYKTEYSKAWQHSETNRLTGKLVFIKKVK